MPERLEESGRGMRAVLSRWLPAADLRLSVTVNEPNVAQIVASVVHGAA
jgi:hypothetical protein